MLNTTSEHKVYNCMDRRILRTAQEQEFKVSEIIATTKNYSSM